MTDQRITILVVEDSSTCLVGVSGLLKIKGFKSREPGTFIDKKAPFIMNKGKVEVIFLPTFPLAHEALSGGLEILGDLPNLKAVFLDRDLGSEEKTETGVQLFPLAHDHINRPTVFIISNRPEDMIEAIRANYGLSPDAPLDHVESMGKNYQTIANKVAALAESAAQQVFTGILPTPDLT